MGYLQDAELGLPWEGKPVEEVLADQQAQNVRLLKMVSNLAQQLAVAVEALEAIADNNNCGPRCGYDACNCDTVAAQDALARLAELGEVAQ